RVEKTLIKENPGLVLVFGDTNSTLAGALAASKLRIKIAHVEAGLRSFNKTMPEEINRILVDHCSDLLFCPTVTAIKNLKNEGIIEGVHLTGDVMVDALKENLKIAERKSKILKELDLKSKEYFLATVHRAENVDDPARLKSIVEAFHELEDLVFPCHPRTERRLKEFDLWSRLVESIRVIKPVAYWDMLMLERGAKIVLTDSGGVQKEAYLLKTPCITLRENTEWIETIKLGANHLVGSNKLKIIESINKVIRNEKAIKKRLERLPNPFGDGRASEKMASIITSTFLR
ncbi:MAG: UDP-N-acetylglucosamine 2-epimerase (non-hydrolyzing), partial [Candidatus Bathyarchaeia archaeon]